MLNKISNFLHKQNTTKPMAVILVTLLIILCTLLLIGKGLFNHFQTGVEGTEDYLIYIAKEYSGKGQLIFYDPVENIHTMLLPDWDVDRISISRKNRLAFSSSQEGNSEIYVLDFPFTDNEPQNITHNALTEDNLFSWSPDGRYLAFESEQDDEKTLSIWDGRTISQIHHYQVQIGDLAWSLDGRLAFTEFYTFIFPYEGDPSEIFIWDGDTTVSLSQNPSGEDRYPAWKMDGQLAFLSEREEKIYDIFVWDGGSNINGLPDVNSFVNIAPNLTDYYSNPVWTNSGSLTFGASEGGFAQIYEWDGEKATNISQNPDLHNGGQSWRSDGYWSFVTYFSGQQLLYIRNEENQTILTTEGQYAPAWSQKGYLTFCKFTPPDGWILSMWDGTKIIEIAQNNIIDAVWRNGEDVYCSS